MIRRTSPATPVLALLLGALPTLASAHAALVSSEPGERAELRTPPPRVRLCFSERIEPSFSRIAIAAGDGAPIVVGPVQADPASSSCLTATLPPLAVGRYSVTFHVLSVDGHVVDRSFGFTVVPPPHGP